MREHKVVRKGHVEFTRNERQRRCRSISDYHIFNAVKIRSVGCPVILISRHFYRFVWFELDKFEGAGADRGPGIGRRDLEVEKRGAIRALLNNAFSAGRSSDRCERQEMLAFGWIVPTLLR
jgi:hypothetical protein